ncbi:hypothetical protein [Paenibacillus methanolicus]|uniref:Uncharacterized protein n=1 Tax=Paenibacillus methanolicus TaxID=582686 RepID=A0A5S5C8H8_9BACL|nr:hypothetical protein [Paenibacillus methanolicus]TYP75705.1 hypothetical protein BCM02_104386 [Paenibacillus methanolicus]
MTKSYVDQKIAALTGNGGSNSSNEESAPEAVSSVFEVVNVPVGKRIVAKTSAEFVVRAGKAIVVSSDANGVSELTDGGELKPGAAVKNDHLLLAARSGRGIQHSPEQKSGAIVVMARGAYELQEQT